MTKGSSEPKLNGTTDKIHEQYLRHDELTENVNELPYVIN